MIDRAARDEVASALQSYMDGKAKSFALSERLERIETRDATVERVVRDLWIHFDDVHDRAIEGTKPLWDYFHRVLLLLRSDAEVETTRTESIWSGREVVAGICLVAFGLIAWRTGWGPHLFLCSVPFGVVSMILSWGRGLEWESVWKREEALAPFPTFASLRAVRRRVPGFRKAPVPTGLREWSALDELVDLIPMRVAWVLCAPIPLLFQLLPERREHVRLAVSQPCPPA